MRQIIIRENEAGQRLDKYLRKYLKEAPDSFLYKMLRKKNITRNGRKASGDEKLAVGDEIRFFMAEETLDRFMGDTLSGRDTDGLGGGPCKPRTVSGELEAFQKYGELEIVYEDRNILLVNKPAGILSQKAESQDLSLNEWFIGRMLFHGEITQEELRTFRPSVCNRLDRNTSGIVICGKTFSGSRKMAELLRDRGLRKFYRAYVKGAVEKPSYLEGYLKKHESSNQVKLVNQPDGGQYDLIRTAYEPVRVYGDRTLLEIELITGKTHQIRAHLAGIGHPVAGDYKYGDRAFNDRCKRIYGIKPRDMALHSYRLEFPSLSGEWETLSGRRVTAAPPEIFRLLE